jgi:hypothetical protein
MAFTVQDFRSQLKYDGARPNLFECTITFPTGVVSEPAASQEQFTFMCRAASIPGSTVAPISLAYFGREIKVAGNRVYPDWAVTIVNDEDFKVRNAFEQWMNALNSARFNLRDAGMVNNAFYQQDAYVRQYGKAGNLLKEYKLIGVFPTDISPIDLNWASNNTVEEYGVTFAYQWWEELPSGSAEFNVAIV